MVVQINNLGVPFNTQEEGHGGMVKSIYFTV